MTELRRSLEDLEQKHDFIARHIGPRPENKQAMLETLGFDSMDDLVGNVWPTPEPQADPGDNAVLVIPRPRYPVRMIVWLCSRMKRGR